MYGASDNSENRKDRKVNMTVSNQTNRTSVDGDGTTQAIPFTFPATATSDIVVKSRVKSTGVESDPLTENSDYTVSLTADTGGTVTMITTFASSSEIHVIRKTPKTQPLDLEQGGSFNAENIEDAFDKSRKLGIENSDRLDRTLVFPDSDPTSSFADMPSSIDRASKNLTFDSDGKPTASVVVEEGDVTFTDFGTSMAEATDADTARGLIGLDTDDNVEFATITGTTATFDKITDVVAEGPWLDVRVNGATGNGSTDDTTAINAALTAGAGGTVFFPDGTYLVSDDLDISADTTLDFQSWKAIIKMNSSGVSRRILNTQGNDNIVIKNGKIDGQNDVHTGSPHQGISLLDGSNFCIVQNMWVINCGQYGILDGDTEIPTVHSGGKGHQILNNRVDMSAAIASAGPIGIEIFPKGGAGYLAEPGILIDGNIVLGDANLINGIKVNAHRGARIVNNWVDNVASAASAGGITIVTSEHCLIANNIITDSRLGIVVSGVDGTDNGLPDEHIHIINNIIQGIPANGNGIFSGDGFKGLKIADNTVDADGGAGDFTLFLQPVDTDYTELTIENNTFIDLNCFLRDDTVTSLLGFPRVRIANNNFVVADLRVEVADYATIIGNSVRLTVGRSIDVGGDHVSIIDNQVLDGNTGDTASIAGILVTGDFPNIRGNHIENVTASGNMKFGIRCNSTDRPTIRDNTIDGMDTHSFFLDSVTNIVGEQETSYFGTIGATTNDERPIFQAPTRCAITKIFVTNAVNITQSGTDLSTYNVEDKGADGSGTTEVLASNPTTNGIDINAFNPTSLGTIAGSEEVYELAAQSALSLTKTDSNAGRATDEMRVTIQYLTF